MLIAIDGPSASGKGTLSKLLSKQYNIPRLDTGLLYRKVAYIAKMNNYFHLNAFQDQNLENLLLLIHNLKILQEEESILKSEEIGVLASKLASIPQIRNSLYNTQKNFSLNPLGAILDGRDIGTTICPNANYKFYVTAKIEVRAKRRHQELINLNTASHISYQDILNQLTLRDEQDSKRINSPLKVANNAIIIDTTNLNIEDMLSLAISYIK